MEKIPLSTINPIIIKISSIKNIKVFSVGKYSRMFKESKREAKVLNSFNEKNDRYNNIPSEFFPSATLYLKFNMLF